MIIPELFHYINYSVSFLVGVPLNALLVWLIVNRSPEEMRQYRPILLLSTIIDIVYLTNLLVVMPVVAVKDGIAAMLSIGPFGSLPNPHGFIVLMTWDFLYCFSVFSLAVPFVYRYYVICREKKWGLGEFLAMLLVPATLCFEHIGILYFFSYTRSVEENNNRNNLAANEHFGFPVDSNKTYVMACFAETREGGSYVSYNLFLWSGVNYVLTAIFGRRLYRHLNAMAASHLSQDRVRALNKQITTTLILQSVIPFVVEFVPTVELEISTVMGINFDNITLYTTAIFPWILILNPLVTMWVVKAYRRQIRGVCFKVLADARLFVSTPGSRDGPTAPRPPQIAEVHPITVEPDA